MNSDQQIASLTREVAVTVVVPAFNSAATLPRTLDSLAQQTSGNFCVLVVDDGSDTELLDLLPDDPRFLGMRLPVNSGYAAVTNAALDLVESPWMMFVDSDDSLDPECLDVLLTRGEVEGSDVVALPLAVVDEAGRVRTGPFAQVPSPLPAREALRMFIAGRFLFHQHLLFRPNHVRARTSTYSDLAFTFNLLSSVTLVSFEDRALYNYFLRADSVTAQLRPTVWDLARVLDDVEDALSTVFSGREAVAAIHRMRWMQLSYMVSKAASDTRSPRLRSAVYAWCRDEVQFSHLVDALRTRHVGKGLSLGLARISPSLHRRAYRWRSRLTEGA